MADAAWPRTCPRCAHVSYRNPLPVAVALIPVVEATGTGVLAIRRAVAPRAGWYALPGGFIETDESWQEAAAREVQEEAGVIIDPGRLLVRTVFSAPDDTLIIAGESPPIRAEALPPYRSSNESSARAVLRAPQELAFPFHTRLVTEYLAEVAQFSPPAEPRPLPASLEAIEDTTRTAGFAMASDRQTGRLLATLAAAKPGGRLLELGTGTGLGTAWLLHGMDASATLLTIDNDPAAQAVARGHLGEDGRVKIVTIDGAPFLREQLAQGARFDLIFADTWPGKYTHLAEALELLPPGGLYLVDDMQPQPNWPADHAPKAAALRARLMSEPALVCTELVWSTGLIIGVKRGS